MSLNSEHCLDISTNLSAERAAMKGRGRAKQRALSEKRASHARRSRCRSRSTSAKGRTVAALSELSDSCLCMPLAMTTGCRNLLTHPSGGQDLHATTDQYKCTCHTTTKCRRDRSALQLRQSPQRHNSITCTTLRSSGTPLTHHSITAHQNNYPNMSKQCNAICRGTQRIQ